MTPAERKAAERQRKREQGLVRYEVWVYPAAWPAVQAFIAAQNAAKGDSHD
jgi:hypothetical protein